MKNLVITTARNGWTVETADGIWITASEDELLQIIHTVLFEPVLVKPEK